MNAVFIPQIKNVISDLPPRVGEIHASLSATLLPSQMRLVEELIYLCATYRRPYPRIKFAYNGRRLDCSDKEWRRLREIVFARDDYTCTYCGDAESDLHCDHVHPLSRGGKSVLDNLTTACAFCNISKGNKTPEEWESIN